MSVELPTRYRLVRQIGAGRTATVWLARDSRNGVDVAIKVISPPVDALDCALGSPLVGTPDRQRDGQHDGRFANPAGVGEVVLGRFESEVRSLSRLRGVAGVAQVHELGLDSQRRPWIVCDYLPGGSLAERQSSADAEVVKGQLSRADCMRLFTTLAAVHGLGIAHGDISPNNILFDRRDLPVLVDFGMASLSDQIRRRIDGLTPAFAAPERIRGAVPSQASDIYSLAASLKGAVAADESALADLFGVAMVADPKKRPDAPKILRRLRRMR